MKQPTPRSSRRDFLKTTTTAVAAAALAPTALSAADAPVQRAIKKGIMLDTVGVKGTVLERFKAVKAAGFDGVEPLGGMNQDEVLKALEATGLQAASVCCHSHWAKPLSSPDPQVRDAGVEGLKQSLRDAKRYGASSVLFVPAVVDKKISYADAYVRSQEGMRQALPLAQELGVVIAIENVWNNFLLSPLEAARYVDEFNSKFVGWHFDCGNIANYGWPEQWIRILGKRIVKIHIKEFSRPKADKEGKWKGFDVKLLDGDNDWPAILKALDDIGYRGWAITEQGGGDSPEGLKDLAARLDKILAS